LISSRTAALASPLEVCGSPGFLLPTQLSASQALLIAREALLPAAALSGSILSFVLPCAPQSLTFVFVSAAAALFARISRGPAGVSFFHHSHAPFEVIRIPLLSALSLLGQAQFVPHNLPGAEALLQPADLVCRHAVDTLCAVASQSPSMVHRMFDVITDTTHPLLALLSRFKVLALSLGELSARGHIALCVCEGVLRLLTLHMLPTRLSSADDQAAQRQRYHRMWLEHIRPVIDELTTMAHHRGAQRNGHDLLEYLALTRANFEALFA
jgi:hypothetical protein